MRNTAILVSFATIVLVGFVLLSCSTAEKEMAFGGEKDVEFANKLWKAMEGYENWLMKSDVSMGASPHGQFVGLYYNMVNVDGKPYHVIVKDNFGGKDTILEIVSKSPKKYLVAVTPMVQREAGYDPDNNDWFWVKYSADGTVDKNPKGMALAGRVAKGMETGCIACHMKAKDKDYLFTND